MYTRGMNNLPKLKGQKPMVTRTFSTPEDLYIAARDKAHSENRYLSTLFQLWMELFLEDEMPTTRKPKLNL